nr:unnamed protein product [Callosobruchus chinensis]
MEQVIYTKCKQCELVFNPRDILKHKSCSAKKITTTPHSSMKKVKNKGSSSKKSGSNVCRQPLSKEPSNSNAPVPMSVSSASSSSSPAAASGQSVVEMAVEKVTSTPVVKTTAAAPTKSEMTVSTSGSSKGHSTHSQKSHHASWPSKTETGGSTSATSSALPANNYSSSSHGHHHGHGHGHHDHHHSSSTHSNHGHSSNSSSSSSSRHRKSMKTNSSCRVAVKEFDPDIHCGVVEPGKGPCTRSVTCSNHRVRKIPFRRVRLKYMLHG